MRHFVGANPSHESVLDATTLLKFGQLLLANDLTKSLFDEMNAYLGSQAWLKKRVRVPPSMIVPSDRPNKQVMPAGRRL